MQPRRQPVPVRLPHRMEGPTLWRYKDRHDGEDPPCPRVELAPGTLVIVRRAPSDDKIKAKLGDNWPNRVRIPSLDDVLIQPLGHRLRKTILRKTKVMQIRWRYDAMHTVRQASGRVDPRCKDCKKAKRLYWWYGSQGHPLVRQDPKTLGCHRHCPTIEVEEPHPDRGRVLGVVTTEKLLGLAPNTEILVPIDEVWQTAWVDHYPFWDDRVNKEAADLAYEANARGKIRKQKERSNAGRRARDKQRKYMAQPTWPERLLHDRFGV